MGAPQKEKNPGALGTCPVCPLVKTPAVVIVSVSMSVRYSGAVPCNASSGKHDTVLCAYWPVAVNSVSGLVCCWLLQLLTQAAGDD